MLKQLKQFSSFILCGLVAFIILILITYFLTEIVGLWYLASYAIGILVAWTISFLLNSRFTFEYKGGNKLGAYKKFILLYMTGGIINFLLVYFLTDFLGLYYLISILIVAFFIVISTFFINREVIFK